MVFEEIFVFQHGLFFFKSFFKYFYQGVHFIVSATRFDRIGAQHDFGQSKLLIE